LFDQVKCVIIGDYACHWISCFPYSLSTLVHQVYVVLMLLDNLHYFGCQVFISVDHSGISLSHTGKLITWRVELISIVDALCIVISEVVVEHFQIYLQKPRRTLLQWFLIFAFERWLTSLVLT
jgi:hypothetical protein